MVAAETTQGLARLGTVHETTLPFSPEQNGKQERSWGQIEGRLLPMLEGVADLSLRWRKFLDTLRQAVQTRGLPEKL